MLLIELSGYDPFNQQEVDYQFSDIGYFDHIKNKIYPGLISDSLGLSTEIEIQFDSPNARSYIGDIKLYNHDGELDFMIDQVFTHREIRMYTGSEYADRAQFNLVFSGYIDDVYPEKDFISFRIKDKLEVLNKKIPLKEIVVGGEYKFLPLCLGDCFNISPVLVDPANHIYQVHDGEVEDIIEVRDDGVKVEFLKDNKFGKFKLARSPFGQITCDVHAGAMILSASDAIKYLIDFSIKNINYTLNSDLTMSIGIYIENNDNLLDLINQICTSANAFFIEDRVLNSFKTLDIFSMDLQSPTKVIEKDEILDFSVTERIIPTARFWVNYAKNWTIQENTAGAVTAEFSDQLRKKFLTEIFQDNEKELIYRSGFAELSAKETLLVNRDELAILGKKWLDYYKEIRTLYTIKMVLDYGFYIGMCVKINYNRFRLGLRTGFIVAISEDFVNGQMIIKVIV